MHDEYTCELCGSPTDRKIVRIVEGVRMIVCPNCQDMGEIPKQKPRRNPYQQQRYGGTQQQQPSKQRYYLDEAPNYPAGQTHNHSANPSIKFRRRPNKIGSHGFVPRERAPNIENLELVDDYRNILKKTRSKLGLTQNAFANSVSLSVTSYKNIENGKLDLTIKEALKIEKKYDIKLTEEISEEEFDNLNDRANKNEGLTLGDVFFKRKKKQDYDFD